MRGTTRTTTIAAAVAAGALVLGGSAVALAGQGQGFGQGNGQTQGNSQVGEGAAGMDRGTCGHDDASKDRTGNGRAGKGRAGKGQAGQGQAGHGGTDTANLDLGVLTPEQEEQMAFMVEEEKMAGDLYEVFFDRYGVRVFTNIAASEDRHADSVRTLLDAYGLDDPTVGLAVGEFTIPEVQALYDELLAQGSESVEAALQVGVFVEETDIADLTEAVEGLSAPRATAVYENLLAGSQNHLKAFSR